jgi:putative DNA-invertase from lambdoid prophage Rac
VAVAKTHYIDASRNIVKETKMAVYGYMRVSTSRQIDGESFDIQEQKIRAYAELHSLGEVENIYQDDISGSIYLEDRTEGADMLEGVKEGDAIISSKLDRMFRSAKDALTVSEQLKDKGVSIHLIDLGGDIHNGLGKVFFTISAAFAEAERDRIRERVAEAKASGRAKGKYLGGSCRFGWAVDENNNEYELEDEQQAIREMIVIRKTKGLSCKRIADLMTGKGFVISERTVNNIMRRNKDDIIG